jgi:hypothetical protein
MLMNIHCLFVTISFCFSCPSSLLPQDFTLTKINLPLNYQVYQTHSLPIWVKGYSIVLHILSEHIIALLHSLSTLMFIHCRSKLQWCTARFIVGIILHTEIIFSCILLKWLLRVAWLLQDFKLCTPRHSTQGILYFQNIIWFHSTHYFMYAHMISTALPIQIF